MRYWGFSVHVFLILCDSAQSLPWNGPPQTTTTPSASSTTQPLGQTTAATLELRKRLEPPRLCGFQDNVTNWDCPPAETCLWNTNIRAVGCCTDTANLNTCGMYTTCVDYSNIGSCTGSCSTNTLNLLCTNTAAPACVSVTFGPNADFFSLICTDQKSDIHVYYSSTSGANLTSFMTNIPRYIGTAMSTTDSSISSSSSSSTSSSSSSKTTHIPGSGTGGGNGQGGGNGGNNAVSAAGSSSTAVTQPQGGDGSGTGGGNGGGKKVGAIVGGSLGGFIIVSLTGAAIAFFVWRRRKNRRKRAIASSTGGLSTPVEFSSLVGRGGAGSVVGDHSVPARTGTATSSSQHTTEIEMDSAQEVYEMAGHVPRTDVEAEKYLSEDWRRNRR